eukprot:1136480-Pelagomonas_calceolata.AAC.4
MVIGCAAWKSNMVDASQRNKDQLLSKAAAACLVEDRIHLPISKSDCTIVHHNSPCRARNQLPSILY